MKHRIASFQISLRYHFLASSLHSLGWRVREKKPLPWSKLTVLSMRDGYKPQSANMSWGIRFEECRPKVVDGGWIKVIQQRSIFPPVLVSPANAKEKRPLLVGNVTISTQLINLLLCFSSLLRQPSICGRLQCHVHRHDNPVHPIY